MARINVPFKVSGQMISQVPKTEIAAGGKNLIYATFDLCETWDKINYKYANFIRGNDKYIVELVHGDNYAECLIPWEVMTKPGYFTVGIFGGDRLPTTLTRVDVITGCCCEGIEPQPPTPDWFTKTNEQVAKLIEVVGDTDTALDIIIAIQDGYIAQTISPVSEEG